METRSNGRSFKAKSISNLSTRTSRISSTLRKSPEEKSLHLRLYSFHHHFTTSSQQPTRNSELQDQNREKAERNLMTTQRNSPSTSPRESTSSTNSYLTPLSKISTAISKQFDQLPKMRKYNSRQSYLNRLGVKWGPTSKKDAVEIFRLLINSLVADFHGWDIFLTALTDLIEVLTQPTTLSLSQYLYVHTFHTPRLTNHMQYTTLTSPPIPLRPQARQPHQTHSLRKTVPPQINQHTSDVTVPQLPLRPLRRRLLLRQRRLLRFNSLRTRSPTVNRRLIRRRRPSLRPLLRRSDCHLRASTT